MQPLLVSSFCPVLGPLVQPDDGGRHARQAPSRGRRAPGRIAAGRGIDAPLWDIPRSYQPKWKRHIPRVQGATNPVWVDADGDGRHTPPRDYARREIRRARGGFGRVIAALKPYDQAVAAQAASLLHEAGHDPRSGLLGQALKQATPVVRAGFDAYAATLPSSKK